jgi:hypothetical protein
MPPKKIQWTSLELVIPDMAKYQRVYTMSATGFSPADFPRVEKMTAEIKLVQGENHFNIWTWKEENPHRGGSQAARCWEYLRMEVTQQTIKDIKAAGWVYDDGLYLPPVSVWAGSLKEIR